MHLDLSFLVETSEDEEEKSDYSHAIDLQINLLENRNSKRRRQEKFEYIYIKLFKLRDY